MGSGKEMPAGKEIIFRRSITVQAPPAAVYEVLADVRGHLEWGGERSGKKYRLTGIEVGDSPAVQGTTWTSTGIAPDGTFRDRSVVTEASAAKVFEFATDAHITLRKGGEADWRLVNRYDIEPQGSGARLTYTQRMTDATDLGPMKMMLNPVLAPIGRMMVGGLVKPAMNNLAAMAEERARGA